MRRAKLREPVVAQAAAGHLHAATRSAAVILYIKVNGTQLHLQFTAKVGHEPAVAIALLPSQMEIAVGCNSVRTQTMKRREQSNTVSPSAQGNQHPSSTERSDNTRHF